MRQYIWVGGGHYIIVRAKDLRAARRLFNNHIKESSLDIKDITAGNSLVLHGKPDDSIKIDDKIKPAWYWWTTDGSKR